MFWSFYQIASLVTTWKQRFNYFSMVPTEWREAERACANWPLDVMYSRPLYLVISWLCREVTKIIGTENRLERKVELSAPVEYKIFFTRKFPTIFRAVVHPINPTGKRHWSQPFESALFYPAVRVALPHTTMPIEIKSESRGIYIFPTSLHVNWRPSPAPLNLNRWNSCNHMEGLFMDCWGLYDIHHLISRMIWQFTYNRLTVTTLSKRAMAWYVTTELREYTIVSH